MSYITIKKDDYLEELYQFLAGVFHQDMESIEESMYEFVNDINAIYYLPKTIKSCESFLNDDNLNEKEKEHYIEEHTYIYFPGINMKPIDWLIEIVEIMKSAFILLSLIDKESSI